MQYADGTFITRREGPFAGEVTGGRAVCKDGVQRNIHPSTDGIADTFFSVPVYVYAQGRRVYGYLTVETREGYLTATDSDPAIVKFIAYTYRKHHALVGG